MAWSRRNWWGKDGRKDCELVGLLQYYFSGFQIVLTVTHSQKFILYICMCVYFFVEHVRSHIHNILYYI